MKMEFLDNKVIGEIQNDYLYRRRNNESRRTSSPL